MTIKLEEKLYKLGQSIGLTFDEREAMRARLLSKIAISEREALSPFSPMFYWRLVMQMKPQYVSVALLVILVIGGVSTAAEKALPGEPLYQVKTSVNENVLGLFAFTPQSKAQLHTELAVRRLEEVEKLAISGKLDATTTAAAEVKIDSNLAVIKDSVKQLETDNNSLAAADTSSKAESSLKVHEAILGTLVDGNAVVNDSVQDMAAKVSIQATALSLDRAGIDSRSGSTTLSIDVLLVEQKSAQGAIAFLQAALSTSTAPSSVADDIQIVSSTLTTSTATSTATSTIIAKAQAGLQIASDLLAQGSEKLDAKDYGEAFVLLKEAEKTAVDARLMLEGKDVLETTPVSGGTSTSTATSTKPISEESGNQSVL
jgi:hypothetical protein